MSETIAADQGVIAADSSAPASYHHTSSHHVGQLSQAQYNQAMYHNNGAGEWTMTIMMMSLLVGYAFFGVLMAFTCFVKRGAHRARAGFVQFDVEEAEQDEQQKIRNQCVSDLNEQWRKAFITKVYSLLVIQIFITMATSIAMMTLGGYDFYLWSLTDGVWTRGFSLIATFVLIIALMCYKDSSPLNLVLLLAFTLTMSYTIGILCTAYAAMGMQLIVVEAFAITSLLFIALTAFAMISKIDFSFLGLILPILLFILIIWGFFSMFAFPSFEMRQVYALAGTVIFALYVLYDTWAITTYLRYDDYILGAINLYLDFINLFIFILQLLAGGRRD